jgi:S1-C subfamily serine protease
MGLTVMNLSPAVAEELSIDAVNEGVAVAAVADGSNAQQVGFQKGDILLSINNERVANSRDVERLTKDRQYRWLLQISRGGQVFTQQLFGG